MNRVKRIGVIVVGDVDFVYGGYSVEMSCVVVKIVFQTCNNFLSYILFHVFYQPLIYLVSQPFGMFDTSLGGP